MKKYLIAPIVLAISACGGNEPDYSKLPQACEDYFVDFYSSPKEIQKDLLANENDLLSMMLRIADKDKTSESLNRSLKEDIKLLNEMYLTDQTLHGKLKEAFSKTMDDPELFKATLYFKMKGTCLYQNSKISEQKSDRKNTYLMINH